MSRFITDGFWTDDLVVRWNRRAAGDLGSGGNCQKDSRMPLNQEDKERLATGIGFVVTFVLLSLICYLLRGSPGCG